MLYTLIGLFSLIIILLIAPKLNEKLIILLCLFIIANKGIEIIIGLSFGRLYKIPIEVSTITYFLLPLFILFKKQKLIEVFTFFGLISGIGYLSLFIVSGSTLYQLNGLYNTVQGLINHTIIFMLSLYYMRYNPQKNFIFRIWITTFILLSYILTISLLIDYSNQSVFIIRVLKGSYFIDILNPFFASFSLIIYYLIIFSLYHLSIYLYLFINNWYTKSLYIDKSLH